MLWIWHIIFLHFSCIHFLGRYHACRYPDTFRLHFNSLRPSDTIWPHRSGSTLAQLMACCLTAPSHYLNQCWLTIIKVPWHSPEGITIRSSADTRHRNKIQFWIFKIDSRFPRGQWVKNIINMRFYQILFHALNLIHHFLTIFCIHFLERYHACRYPDTFRLHFNSLRPSDTIWPHRSGSTLAQVMACCLTAPSHYLNQCWLASSKVRWHSSESDFTRDTPGNNHWN